MGAPASPARAPRRTPPGWPRPGVRRDVPAGRHGPRVRRGRAARRVDPRGHPGARRPVRRRHPGPWRAARRRSSFAGSGRARHHTAARHPTARHAVARGHRDRRRPRRAPRAARARRRLGRAGRLRSAAGWSRGGVPGPRREYLEAFDGPGAGEADDAEVTRRRRGPAEGAGVPSAREAVTTTGDRQTTGAPAREEDDEADTGPATRGSAGAGDDTGRPGRGRAGRAAGRWQGPHLHRDRRRGGDHGARGRGGRPGDRRLAGRRHDPAQRRHGACRGRRGGALGRAPHVGSAAAPALVRGEVGDQVPAGPRS